MSLDREQVRWVSHLARLDMDDAELEKIGKKLSAVVDYIDQLKQINTDNVEPLAHPLPISNVFRDDEAGQSLSVDDALSNAPMRHGDFFAVPAVLE